MRSSKNPIATKTRMRSNKNQFTRREFAKLLGGAGVALSVPGAFAAATNRGPIWFQNAAPGCGLDFVLRNDAGGRKYQVETVLGGLGVIDFDHDGWPDLYCVTGAALPNLQKTDPRFFNRLYRNNRDGTFTDVTQKAGVQGHGYDMGVAVGDYNNDGFEDLYVVGVHGNTLYRNNGDGIFTDVTQAAGVSGSSPQGRKLWSVAAAWLDYDNDGHLDLIVSNYCDWTPGDDPLCGGLNSTDRTYCHPDKYRAEPVLLYHNNGDGTFTEVLPASAGKLLGKGMGIAIADYDGDGLPDIFIANDNDRNLLLHNLGGGKVKEVGMQTGIAYNGDGRQISGMGADFRDFDGDGLPDILMTGLRGETFELFRNNGNGAFEDASASSGLLNLSRPWSGWGCGFVDLDNDGWLDIFVACGGLDTNEPQPNRVLHNVGGRFSDVSASAGADFAGSRVHRGVAFADFDNDGRIDAAVTSLNEPIELWMNRSPMQHWLQLKLKGTRSNSSALGAKVICRTAQRTQVTFVANSVGYASSSDLRVHFGLGEDRKATLEIHWPSGTVQELKDVSSDQLIRIEEIEPPAVGKRAP
ncbi:MAG: ASPIC/UnbV domain protein [Acidobacteriaceae bacterium]|nr:ASPIC/UnbV domain protein [Acidobacteriaceae bacterium]